MKLRINTPLFIGVLILLFSSSESWSSGKFHSDSKLPHQKTITVKMPVPPTNFPSQLLLHIYTECEENSVPFLLVCKLIEAESSWNIHARNYNKNKKGVITSIDYSIMQINSTNLVKFSKWYGVPGWKYDIANNPYDNVSMGIRHLHDLFIEFGDWRKAIAAYNCGSYQVWKNRIPESTKKYVNKIIPRDYWWNFPLQQITD